MNEKFFSLIKPFTEEAPASTTDHKILSVARERFNSQKHTLLPIWKISGLAVVASIVFILIFFRSGSTPYNDSVAINESLEMILNYNEIELMAESSALSESDWNHLNKVK